MVRGRIIFGVCAMPGIPSHQDKIARYGKKRQKVPPFARYPGTSAWRKYRVRVRAYAAYLAGVHAHAAPAAPLAT